MNSKKFKCFIPSCPNSVSKTRDKVFVHVNDCLKRKWCKQINIPYYPQQRLYCCEDHLNLKEDLENYYNWKLMKARPRLKPTANLHYPFNVISTLVPSSTENVYQIGTSNESTSILETLLLEPMPTHASVSKENYCQSIPSTSNSSTSLLLKSDAATQYEAVNMIDKSTLVRKYKKATAPPIMEGFELATSASTTSATPSLYGCTSETDVSDLHEEVNKSHNLRNHIINLIYTNPKTYIGLPKPYLWIIKVIVEEMSVKEIDILIVLMKIKVNYSMIHLSHFLQLSRSTLSASFHKGIVALSNYFQNFIFMPLPLKIKENLPLVFKIRYSNVQCIIDAFEIEIEKPTDPMKQAQTWSQYKHCNTVKYLVSSTPNGFINYVSKGYGGRISDKTLVEISKFIDVLPINAVIMADRGFKEIETLLMTKNIKLLRPPSVYSSRKPTKEEVLQSKVIASLRIHIERVIRRIREFRILKPHSVVSHKHVGYLDKLVLIACGMVNLQNEIIKG